MISLRQLSLGLVVGTAIATNLVGVAEARLVPGVSATMTSPNPNPLSAGSTASVSAQFSVSMDVGAITVAIELQNADGSGALRLDVSGTTAELVNCVEATSIVTCDWDGESADGPQTLTVFIDADETAQPDIVWTLAAIVDSSTTDPVVLASSELYISPPVGTTSLSGIAITTAGSPVAGACVFILSSPSFVFLTVSDPSGAWTMSGLPDSYQFAVAVIPPFVGAFGPCAGDGPPPAAGPGQLQPVFAGDIWVDLADPALTGDASDPFAFASAAGAAIFADSAGGIVTCLTAVAGDVVPRPGCFDAAAPPTATLPTGAPTSTALDPTTSSPDPTAPALTELVPVASPPTRVGDDSGFALPATGLGPSLPLLASALLAVGATVVLVSRRRSLR